MGQFHVTLRGSVLCVFRIPRKGFPAWEALEPGVKGTHLAEGVTVRKKQCDYGSVVMKGQNYQRAPRVTLPPSDAAGVPH